MNIFLSPSNIYWSSTDTRFIVKLLLVYKKEIHWNLKI